MYPPLKPIQGIDYQSPQAVGLLMLPNKIMVFRISFLLLNQDPLKTSLLCQKPAEVLNP